MVLAGTAAARGPRHTRTSGTRGSESSPASLGTAKTLITASSRRRIRSDTSHRSPVPATGHSRACTPPPSRTSSAWPCHSTCRTSPLAHTASGDSVSRARSSAGSRGRHTRTASWPSGRPAAAYVAAARHAEGISHILRDSGRYPLCGRGDVNTYSVFAELMRTLLSPTGRAGIIVPTGIATDDTTKDDQRQTPPISIERPPQREIDADRTAPGYPSARLNRSPIRSPHTLLTGTGPRSTER